MNSGSGPRRKLQAGKARRFGTSSQAAGLAAAHRGHRLGEALWPGRRRIADQETEVEAAAGVVGRHQMNGDVQRAAGERPLADGAKVDAVVREETLGVRL